MKILVVWQLWPFGLIWSYSCAVPYTWWCVRQWWAIVPVLPVCYYDCWPHLLLTGLFICAGNSWLTKNTPPHIRMGKGLVALCNTGQKKKNNPIIPNMHRLYKHILWKKNYVIERLSASKHSLTSWYSAISSFKSSNSISTKIFLSLLRVSNASSSASKSVAVNSWKEKQQ